MTRAIATGLVIVVVGLATLYVIFAFVGWNWTWCMDNYEGAALVRVGYVALGLFVLMGAGFAIDSIYGK